MARDPFETLVQAIAALDTQGRTGLHTGLQYVLAAVAASGTHRRFGVCRDCSYISGDICCNPTSTPAPALECLLLGVPMQLEEAELLCAAFHPTPVRRR